MNTSTSVSVTLRQKILSRRNQNTFIVGLLMFFLFSLVYVPRGVAVQNILLGGVVIFFATMPLTRWLKYDRLTGTVPFFQLLFFTYALTAGFAVFQGKVVFRGEIPVTQDTVTLTLLLILLGMGSLLTGWRIGAIFHIRPPFSYHVDDGRLLRLMMIYLLLLTILALFQRIGIAGMLRGIFGNLFQYIMGSAGLVAIFGLAGYEAQNRLSARQRRYFRIMMLSVILLGISSGWLYQATLPLLIYCFGRLSRGGYISRKLIISLVVAVLFFQVGKNAFREKFWAGKIGGVAISSVAEIPSQISYWITESVQKIGTESEQKSIGKIAQKTMKRFDHLEWFSFVVSQTPDRIPYLEGYSYNDLYKYLIPRFLWSGKPINLEKANFIALRYGWIYPWQVGRTAVTPGLMDEAYINFGIIGVIFVMMIIGAFFRVLTTTFGNPKWGEGWRLVLIVLVCEKWLPISTAASYFGGFIQPIIIVLIMYWPARKRYFTPRSR